MLALVVPELAETISHCDESGCPGMETVKFNQENAVGLGSGKKISVELDGVFRRALV